MRQLNREAYEVTKDNLIYDSRHPLDAINLLVATDGSEAGVIRRGQLLEISTSPRDSAGLHYIHGSLGSGVKPAVRAIVAEDTAYTAEDEGSVYVPAYISGSFRMSACITGKELNTEDMEQLRSFGIYLK